MSIRNSSDLSIFENTTVGMNQLKYYVIPVNYPLFKATKNIRKGETLQLRSDQHSFFGLKNMTPSYIDEYEDEYGVIFEYKTTRVYNLIALNDLSNVDLLYQNAPENIKQILDKNYGHITGKRDSESNNDRTLSLYLCSLNYDGYAIHNMMTESGGIFHTEFMICNCDGIKYVGQITDESRVKGILENAKLKEMSKRMEESRKQAKEEARKRVKEMDKKRLFGMDGYEDEDEIYNKPTSLFGMNDDTPFRSDMKFKTPIRPLSVFQTPSKTATKKRLFGMDDDNDENSEERNPEIGGKKYRKHRSSQNKNKSKKIKMKMKMKMKHNKTIKNKKNHNNKSKYNTRKRKYTRK